MSNVICDKLLETGIHFKIIDNGSVNYRMDLSFRDENIHIGDGYSLDFKIGETRGEVRLSFDTFSKFLVSKSKELLSKNLSSLIKYNVKGSFYLESDGGREILNNSLSFENTGSKEFCLLFESEMFDLRKEDEIEKLKEQLSRVGQLIVLIVLPYETSTFGEVEGKGIEVVTTKYERSRKNRMLCVAHYGYKCQICNFSFGERYGETVESFIHVHHIERVSDGGEVAIDPLNDLIPLCPNCHAVAHLKTPPYTPDELRRLLKKVENESV